LLDTIGNLTLTAYNSPLSNEAWEHKRSILQDSHLELNVYFATCLHWDEDAIRTRAESLATRALEIWKYFGTDKDHLSSQPQSVTGRTPAAVVIYGQRIPVSTWRDVAQQTMETIATLDEERFWKIVDRFPRLLSKDPSRFRSRRELSNGVFVETHLSADAIYRFCLQATELVDMTADDWNIEFQEQGDFA
jgi:hypothetical protein